MRRAQQQQRRRQGEEEGEPPASLLRLAATAHAHGLSLPQVSSVEGEEHRGMHLFKFQDTAAANELNSKILEFVA